MTEHVDRRSDMTRLQILYSAARLFAEQPYSRVSLDDILADASVTKGAMYFHFRSKHALADAIVDHRSAEARVSVDELLARRLAGLETLVDIWYLFAVDDLCHASARAAWNLLESIGRIDDLQTRVLGEWVQTFAQIIQKAVDEGDLRKECGPENVARLLLSLYLGLRQTSSLAEPQRFLRDLEAAWSLVVPGFVTEDRQAYVTEFIKRRTSLAIKKVAQLSNDL